MFIIGLTGGIATGKSLVASIFKENGITIIDADVIARQIVEPGQAANKQIKKSFGTHVFMENGELDRTKLGIEIFSSVEKRKLLNSITHPYIYGTMKKQVFRCFLNGEQFVVMDLPLLFETKSVLPYLYKTIVVMCDEDQQLSRLMARNTLSRNEAMRRVDSQMPLEAKVSMSDFVIENSSSMIYTRNQTEEIIKHLKTSKHHITNKIYIFSLLFLSFAALITLIVVLFRYYEY